MEPEGKPVLWGRKPQAKSAGAGRELQPRAPRHCSRPLRDKEGLGKLLGLLLALVLKVL